MDEQTVKSLTKEIGDLNRLVSTAEKLLRKLQTGNLDKETKDYQREIKEIIKKTKAVLEGDATRKDTKALQELISTSEETLKQIKESNKDNEQFNKSFKRLFGSSHTAGSIAHSMKMSVKDLTDAITNVSNEALSDATDTALDFLPGVKLATKMYDLSGITSAVGNTIKPRFGGDTGPRIEDAFTEPENDENVIRPSDLAPRLDKTTKDDIAEQLRQMREDMAVSVGLDKFGDVTQDKIALDAEQEDLKDAVLGTATSELQEKQIEQDKSLAEMREDSDQRRHLTQQQSMDTLIAAVKGLTKSVLQRLSDWYRRQIDEWKENPIKKFLKTGIQTLMLPITMVIGLFKWFRKRKSEHEKTRDTIMGSGEMVVRAIKGLAAKKFEGSWLGKQIHKWRLGKAEEYRKLQEAGFELSKRQLKHLNKMRLYMAEPPPRPQPVEQIKREQRMAETLEDIKDNTESSDSGGGIFGFGGDFIAGLAGKLKAGLMAAFALAFKGGGLLALGGSIGYGIGSLLNSWLIEPINNWIKDKFGWDPLTNVIGKWVANLVAWMEENIPGFKWLTGGEAGRAVEFDRQDTYDAMMAKRRETEALVMPWERDLDRREKERQLKALEAQRQIFASGIHADPERLAQVNAQIAQIKQTMPVKAERDGVKVELPKGDGEKDKAVIDSMREVADSVKESNDKLVDAVRKLTENIAQADLGVPLDNDLIREIKSLAE